VTLGAAVPAGRDARTQPVMHACAAPHADAQQSTPHKGTTQAHPGTHRRATHDASEAHEWHRVEVALVLVIQLRHGRLCVCVRGACVVGKGKERETRGVGAGVGVTRRVCGEECGELCRKP
jgi:hypothetical protein